MPKYYEKKPVRIVAEFWCGTDFSLNEVAEFTGLTVEELLQTDEYIKGSDLSEGIWIPTLEGLMHASVGDYIIRGVQGEFYPCKPDIFQLTYREVDDFE